MDPVSQAVLGASLSQSFSVDKSKQVSALIIGALAGMAPDLDVVIQSPTDPMLFLEYHRQFTHSLFFIPFGALICALFFYPFFKSKLSIKQIYLFSFLGFATHGLLDACTSYGTQLFWPFSNVRVAWNTVSIIDPFFTFPILFLIIYAARRQKILFAQIAFCYAVFFLALGIIQHQRAETAVVELAKQRGHEPVRIDVKPSFGNRHLWKLIYEYENRYYVDAVRLLWDVEYLKGDSIQKLDVKQDLPWLPENSQYVKDIERFRWFSNDYLAVSSFDPNFIIDIRYSFLPNSIHPMWGIGLDKDVLRSGDMDWHVAFKSTRSLDASTRKQFFEMLF